MAFTPFVPMLSEARISRSESIEMETQFTPLASLFGGLLIGLSAVILMATNGRIAGISGIVSRLLPPAVERPGVQQGLLFVLGLIGGIPLYALLAGGAPPSLVSGNLPLMAIAGLLVGFGAAFGSGCTSGHGVCGISRFSMRSIIATMTFMATAFVTVFVLRHVM